MQAGSLTAIRKLVHLVFRANPLKALGKVHDRINSSTREGGEAGAEAGMEDATQSRTINAVSATQNML